MGFTICPLGGDRRGVRKLRWSIRFLCRGRDVGLGEDRLF